MPLPYDLVPLREKQVGLIVLQADETLERDMQALVADAEVLVSRVPSAPRVSSESLQAMADDLTQAASLLPEGADLCAVAYGCTSGTAQIGADKIASLIKAGKQTPVVTDPVTALIAACKHLGLRRIGLISPYVQSVSDRLRRVLTEAGISVSEFASFDEPTEANVVRISGDAIARAAIDMGQLDTCDGVFLSCTNLRTLDIIRPIETAIDKPVLSSNLVLAWHLCQIAELTPLHGCGALFDAR